MTFDDFCALYIVFKEQRDEEMVQVMFSMIRINPAHIANLSPEEQEASLPSQMQAQRSKISDVRPAEGRNFFVKKDLEFMSRLLGLNAKVVKSYYL